ncbi:MAG TPA: NADH-quinone oxidoreductase subunit N [Acidimicrobiia bacterium]|nr:NADH-quinone oxidoreductase subunit N [Acidimicrobiia bacterium]
MIAQASIPAPTISWLGIAPELVLGLGAALVLLIEVQWKPPRRVLAWTAGGVLVLGGVMAVVLHRYLDAGNGIDQLPFAGLIALDGFGVFARYVLFAVAGLGLLAARRMIEEVGPRAAEMLALMLLATAGFSLMAVSANLVMTFLGLEVGSISLYVLAGFAREREDSDEAAIKYFLLGSFASAVFVYGVALVFAGTGSFTLPAVREYLTGVVVLEPGVILLGLALVIVGLCFKVTAAPFHSWAPDVYQGAPAGAVGFMAAIAKIGGFAALVRILVSAFPAMAADWAPVVATISAVSMVLGSVLAIVQDDLRRLLAYSGVAHAGFILTGLLSGADGTADVWFYLAVYTIQLVASFAVVAAVSGSSGSRSALADYAGLAQRQPFLAATFTVILLGMGGLPLTSGFVAKFGVFTDAWAAGYEWVVVVGVLASVVAFFFYLRVVVTMYMDEPDGVTFSSSASIRWVMGLAVASTIIFGIFPGPLLDLAGNAIPL